MLYLGFFLYIVLYSSTIPVYISYTLVCLKTLLKCFSKVKVFHGWNVGEKETIQARLVRSRIISWRFLAPVDWVSLFYRRLFLFVHLPKTSFPYAILQCDKALFNDYCPIRLQHVYYSRDRLMSFPFGFSLLRQYFLIAYSLSRRHHQRCITK